MWCWETQIPVGYFFKESKWGCAAQMPRTSQIFLSFFCNSISELISHFLKISNSIHTFLWAQYRSDLMQNMWSKFGSFVDFHCSALTAKALSFLPCVFLNFHHDNQPSTALKSLWHSFLVHSSDILFNIRPLTYLAQLWCRTTDGRLLQYMDPSWEVPCCLCNYAHPSHSLPCCCIMYAIVDSGTPVTSTSWQWLVLGTWF
jgi:hypothetical protein